MITRPTSPLPISIDHICVLRENTLRHIEPFIFFLVTDKKDSFERFQVYCHRRTVFPIDHTHRRPTCLPPFQSTGKNKVVKPNASVAMIESDGNLLVSDERYQEKA